MGGEGRRRVVSGGRDRAALNQCPAPARPSVCVMAAVWCVMLASIYITAVQSKKNVLLHFINIQNLHFLLWTGYLL